MMSEDFKMKIGDKAPDFSLPATNGRTYSLFSFQKSLVVIVFTCNHCPYAKAYERKLIALAKDFSANADFVAVNSNDSSKYPEDNFLGMKERTKAKKFPYPYLHDEPQDMARAYGALVTPHVFVFDRQRKLVYQGGIDDSFSSGNYNNEKEAAKHYLRDALTAAAAGKEIRKKTSPAVGCSVKWK